MDTDISSLKLATDNQIEKMKYHDVKKPKVFFSRMPRSKALTNKLKTDIEKIGRYVICYSIYAYIKLDIY